MQLLRQSHAEQLRTIMGPTTTVLKLRAMSSLELQELKNRIAESIRRAAALSLLSDWPPCAAADAVLRAASVPLGLVTQAALLAPLLD